jgi:hypothetical protein
MKIDSYQFGEIVVNGNRYNADVLIFPDKVRSNWWRKEGHKLSPQDLIEVIEAKPEVLVVGKGNYGMMEILPETEYSLKEQGIELIAQASDKACQTYNQLCDSRKVVAALHLTC